MRDETQQSESAILLSVPAAARKLSISARKLFLMVQQGEIAHVRCGRRVLVPVSAIEAWVQNNTSPAV